MAPEPMMEGRFEALAEAYGGDVAAWPAAERDAAAAFMTAEPARAGAVLARADALDSALAAYSPPRAASGLMDRIVASTPKPRPAGWWRGWLAPAGMGAGLAAACAAGMILGVRISAPSTVAADDALITAVSDEDFAFDFDEEA